MSTLKLADGPTLGKSEATKLNTRIKTLCGRIDRDAGELLTLLEQAAAGNIHVALDYKSWTAWWAENVRFDVTDRLERKSLVVLMSGKGMSQRAIGASLGVNQATVSRDLGDANASPAPDNVIGLDGKKYTKPKPEPEQEPLDVPEVPLDVDEVALELERFLDLQSQQPKLPPLTEDFRNEVCNLQIAVQALRDILADDRFPQARRRIANLKARADLHTVVSDLDGILDVIEAN